MSRALASPRLARASPGRASRRARRRARSAPAPHGALGPDAVPVASASASAAAIMVVSDLDGTMVGDDAATAAFTAAWTRPGALPPGSALVYSTGRSLESFAALIRDKRDVMATPDALVCAVGTKVYRRARGSNPPLPAWLGWEEDPAWTARLDRGWDFDAVLEIARDAIETRVGAEEAHFRPREEFTSHKITIGARDEVVETLIARVSARCAAKNLDVKCIASGVGGWQYVDIVAAGAGKLESLEYVREAYGVALERCVACGDSGNDELMLAGACRAVVVGNAQPALMRWAELEAEKNAEVEVGDGGDAEGRTPGGAKRLHIAERAEAYGILEGLEAFGLLKGGPRPPRAGLPAAPFP